MTRLIDENDLKKLGMINQLNYEKKNLASVDDYTIT